MDLVLDVVLEDLGRGRHVYPGYEVDPRFNSNWWQRGSAKTPVTFCRLLDGGEEVARAKIHRASRSYSGYGGWACPAEGATEVDLIEVRPDLRRLADKHYGREMVREIEEQFGSPLVAMSLDNESDGFWQRLGWTAHTPPENDGRRTLFTSP